jgi:hypothetical protein
VLKDASVKGLLFAGLLVQAGAVAAGFTRLGWRWPLIAATTAVALGLFAVGGRRDRNDPLYRALRLFVSLSLAAAAWHAGSPVAAAAWALRIAFAGQVLVLLAPLLFLLTFLMKRLW